MAQSNKVCIGDSCVRLSTKRGMCNMHYTRWHRHGNKEIVKTGSTNTVKYMLNQKNLQRWIELYKSGVPATQIAKQYGVHSLTVWSNLKKASIVIRSLKETRLSNNNPMWAGDKVGYSSLHSWVNRRLVKPATCPNCGLNKPLDLANISQNYLRSLDDWEYLCRKCHMIKDGRLNNFIKYKHAA